VITARGGCGGEEEGGVREGRGKGEERRLRVQLRDILRGVLDPIKKRGGPAVSKNLRGGPNKEHLKPRHQWGVFDL